MSHTKTFRSHLQMPAEVSTETFRLLCHEWVGLNQSAGHIVSSWGHTATELQGFSSPGDVVDAIDQANPVGKDALMGALIELAHDGDALAARVVLQAMLPAICSLMRRCSMPADVNGPDERAQFTIAMFWEVFSMTSRRTHVGRHLMMSTLHKITAHQRRSSDTWEHHTDRHGLDENATTYEAAVDDVECDEILTDGADLYAVLRWARTTHALSASDAQLLTDVYLADHRRADFNRAAKRAGVSVKTVQKRCERARERLVAAVRADIGGHDVVATSAA